MSCSSPTTPQSSSSSPRARAYARMAVSTARQWRRRDSDSTHSLRRDQASSRESLTDMAVRLAEPPNPPLAAPVLMEKFVIDGGVPLRGTVVPAGNKNGALPILAASVLTTEEVVVRNVPRIRDVEAMLRVLRGIGVTVEWRDENEVCLCAAAVDPESHIDREHATRIRASFLLAGPLLARFGHADMPPPGGDVIGRRRLDPHLDAFRALGATFIHERDIVLSAPDGGLRASEVFMDEPSVMATENALLAAALTPGTTVIGNAACEPHVQDLARMLVKMGADIAGIGSNVLTVTGRDELGGCDHQVGPDHIEIGSFIALAGVTGGELRIKDTAARHPRQVRLRVRPPRPAHRARRRRRPRARRPEPDREARRRRVQGEDPGRPVARVPGRPDVDRDRARHPVQRLGPRARVDVREPHGLHRQARLNGRGHRAVRPAPRDHLGPGAPARRAPVLARHPRRDGDADRRAVRRRAQRDPEHPRDRSRLRAHRRAPARPRRADRAGRDGAAARRRVIHPIPSGTRDVLPDEMRELRAITETLREVFERHGYGEVYTPAIEYESVLERAPGSNVQPAYRVFDDHGDVLALRSDMTVPIARLVATRYPTADPPLRFCYIAHAYRAVHPHRGQMREFLQAGIELVGAPGADGTAEALTVLCHALDAVGLGRCRVGLGDASLYPTLMGAFDVPAEAGGRMLEELGRKDLVGLEREVEELGLPPDAADLLVRVPQMRGGGELLRYERGPGGHRPGD